MTDSRTHRKRDRLIERYRKWQIIRQTDRDDTVGQKESEIKAYRENGIQRHGGKTETSTLTESQTIRQTYRQTDRKTDSQTDTQPQTDRYTDRYTDRHRQENIS